MLTTIKKTRALPSLFRTLSQTPTNLSAKVKRFHSLEHNQLHSLGNEEFHPRARPFDPRQLFSDGTLVTPKDIVEYHKSSGISYLAYPEADSFYYEFGFYSPRTVVVAVDGACPGNGTIQAQKSSFGVFFGPDSPLNTYDTITRPSGEKHTNNYAELMAMLHALELLKHHSELRQWIFKHPLLIDCTFKIGVIIITDSKFVHDCLILWLPSWLKNGFRTIEGNPVANKDLILRIHHMMELLSGDLDIQIWHVRREHNRDADELAIRALRT